ncbi:MAG: hypothetical protein II955_03160 [Clostridia bacterium]|nr:hypothetical protein [Clostridia bacterium]
MNEYTIQIDPKKKVRALNNKVSTICIWDYRESFFGRGEDGQIKKANPFVERVQFMTATGGNAERDLFREPENFAVKDDYDFSPLIRACKNALRLGVKPFLKTGSIPLKFTKEPQIGVFGVNMHAPDVMDDYYNYIYALCEALKAEFGTEEVQSWSWGVFTEFENKEWFKASPEPAEAGRLFCEIYDYTVAAITDSLGDGVTVGAHAMMMREILKLIVFEPEQFIRHCAQDRNAKNGRPVKLDYMSFSFYDGRPYLMCSMTFAQVANLIRKTARKYGLNDLRIACDEGRINSGMDNKELSPRTVGFRYQAAMDADLLWQMVNFDVDYFAAWSYRSGGLMDGLKSLGSHMAENYHRMVGMEQIETDPADEASVLGIAPLDFRAHSIAATDGKGKTAVMVYNYQPQNIFFEEPTKVRIELPTKKPDGESTAECRFVDDRANFFPHWCRDRDARGLETKGRWSEDSPEIMTEGFDPAPYEQYSHLIPQNLKTEVRNGVEVLEFTMIGNSAVFVDFR